MASEILIGAFVTRICLLHEAYLSLLVVAHVFCTLGHKFMFLTCSVLLEYYVNATVFSTTFVKS
jgi:hypothetical protein